MIQVQLTNGRETALVFYEMEIPQAIEQALIDRPGYWMQDVKAITQYTVMNGEESFYDSHNRPNDCVDHTVRYSGRQINPTANI